MKKYLSIYTNWRNDVLLALFCIALFLICGDSENTLTFILTKVMGAAVAYAFYKLFRYWNERGEIKELTALAIEED